MVAEMTCNYLTSNAKATEKGVFCTMGIMQEGSVKELPIPQSSYETVKALKPMSELLVIVELTEFKGIKGYRITNVVPQSVRK